MTFTRRLLPVLLLTAALAGCDSSHTDKVSALLDDPAAYAHKDVTVAGEVTKVYELPLGISDLAAYRVSDGTGQIWVLSHAGAPVVGDKVGLKGRLQEEGRIAGTDLGSVIVEEGRKVR